jgi:hypothetical protein
MKEKMPEKFRHLSYSYMVCIVKKLASYIAKSDDN